MGAVVKMSADQRKVLRVLHAAWLDCGEFCFLSFKAISRRTRMPRREVRRHCRALTRKGFARYGFGLWTEDGEFAGSGYACTAAGSEALAA